MMTREEAIKIIEVAKAEVEWEAPLDYQIAFDLAIEALKQYAQREKWKFCPTCGARLEYVGNCKA